MLCNKQTKLNLAILLTTAALSMPALGYAAPIGAAFTYQGQLADANSPAEGSYDFQFAVFDALDGGTQQGSTLSEDDKDVIDGYFTATLDFGAGVFTGDARWLQIAVRPGDTTESFTPLSPRQELTPTPYAIYALSGTQGPKGDKGDTGPAGPQGPMGPEGPAGDVAFSIEDFVARERIGYITIGDAGIQRENVFGIRFGISAFAPDPKAPSQAVDEVQLILDAGEPGLLSLIENIGTANTYYDVLVTLGQMPQTGENLIRLDMRLVTVNSVDFFGHLEGSTYRSLACVSFSIQRDFTLSIAYMNELYRIEYEEIIYNILTGSVSGPTCTDILNVYPSGVSGVDPPYIPLTDFDVHISPSDERVGDPFPCISTITTKTQSYERTGCIWTNCLSLSSMERVRARLYSYDSQGLPYSDTSFEILQAYPQRVKIYSTNESTYNNPVQMEMTYSMNQVVIYDDDQGGNPVTVASCQNPR